VSFHVAELLGDTHAVAGETVATLERVRKLAHELMDAYCIKKGKERWCDKSPGNVDLLPVLGSVFPDAQCICLYRHGLNQAQSFIDMFGAGRLQSYVDRHHGNVPAAALDRWCTKAEAVLGFEHNNPRTTHRVTYERFVEAPEEELQRLLTFLNVRREQGLSVLAFRVSHDQGPADAKIASTSKVERDRARRKSRLDLGQVPASLRLRFRQLSDTLGYDGDGRQGT